VPNAIQMKLIMMFQMQSRMQVECHIAHYLATAIQTRFQAKVKYRHLLAHTVRTKFQTRVKLQYLTPTVSIKFQMKVNSDQHLTPTLLMKFLIKVRSLQHNWGYHRGKLWQASATDCDGHSLFSVANEAALARQADSDDEFTDGGVRATELTKQILVTKLPTAEL
jgi:hypothetical protein